ncbi:MAG: GLUG motif-containing protein, partial [Acinetobacter sp.]
MSINNVILETQAAGSGAGDIHVNAAVSWNAATELTLKAHNNININADISAADNNGKLHLIYGQNTANSNANYYLNHGAKVNLKAGDNFSTQKGTDAVKNYKVITALGAQGSTTQTDLQGINGNLIGNYVLGADIDAAATSGWNAGAGFNPIGNNTTNFSGILDGLGHTISNLTINRPTTDYVGLFGRTNGASIRNIGLLGGSVKGNGSVGGLVGYNNSSISNAYATGSVTGSYSVGGLVGENYGGISNAYATGAVTGSDITGGLTGMNWGGISNAYATGSVTGQIDVGGLVGANGNIISNAYATGSVTGDIFVGGLVGESNGGISNAYWNKETTGQLSGVGQGFNAG